MKSGEYQQIFSKYLGNLFQATLLLNLEHGDPEYPTCELENETRKDEEPW